MRRLCSALCTGALWVTAGTAHADSENPASPVAATVRQLVLVRARSWASSSGLLRRYERAAGGTWRTVGGSVDVNLGRHGLAWGRGLHPASKSGPIKREGDGRSPAGVFALERAFGAAESLPDGSKDFPYLEAKSTSYCVEDVRSAHYNELIDSTRVKSAAWQRWSPLRRADGLFRWGVVVRQNAPDTAPGAGSCVFLHIWRGKRQPTAGCTAMAPESIEAILRWLARAASPVLVQLPEPVYRSVASSWSLPEDPTPAVSATR